MSEWNDGTEQERNARGILVHMKRYHDANEASQGVLLAIDHTLPLTENMPRCTRTLAEQMEAVYEHLRAAEEILRRLVRICWEQDEEPAE